MRYLGQEGKDDRVEIKLRIAYREKGDEKKIVQAVELFFYTTGK